MAGSYGHIVTKSGKLRDPQSLTGMLECSSGDVYEACEELYGMIWFLANQLANTVGPEGVEAGDYVKMARDGFEEGLKVSPGVKGPTTRETIRRQLEGPR